MDQSDDENQVQYASESEEEKQPFVPPQPQGQRTMQRARQNRQQQQQQQQQPNGVQQPNNQQLAQRDERVTGNMGGRTGAIRESRIKDRPVPQETRDSSLKIKIELDLEVEVDLYARVKGDVTIGLM
jgi:hypothetical protein